MHPFRHFRTVCRHRHLVIRHARRAGILWQGLFHDLSKFSPVEFWRGAKYYQGTRSPNEGERETFGYSAAWMHHKGRNKHHFEYWVDVNPETKRYAPVEMPARYLAEMFCDRVAASKTYQGGAYTDGHPLAYFLRGGARTYMHPATAEVLQDWLTVLAEEGEAAAFARIREALKKEKRKKQEHIKRRRQ